MRSLGLADLAHRWRTIPALSASSNFYADCGVEH